jgi:hypothetical protein
VQTISAVRAPRSIAALVCVLAVVAVGCPAASAAAPRAAVARTTTVTGALSGLLKTGAITESAYRQYTGAYAAARRSLTRLSGTRRSELGAVLANVQAFAAAGLFTPTRLPAVFLTLERNRSWWTTEPLLSSGERVSFPHSLIVWEYYAGQGLEIQWLGTFGEANGYFLSGHENGNLRQLLGEVIPLAAQRAGGLAWEYLFRFDGGRPPWTSGLSQGTALQVMARAWSRFKEPVLLETAQKALGVFRVAPPQGVRVRTGAGANYAEYTYAPSDRILNGFIQALVGLYDYTSITKDPLGLALFQAGDAEARVQVPHYDTGAWSLYDQFGESNLNYHELLTEFLQHLCDRTRKGPPLAAGEPAPAPTPTTATPTTTPTATTPTSTTPAAGGAAGPSAVTAAASVAQTGAQIPGDAIYCSTAQRFQADLRTPPKISLLTTSLRSGSRAGVTVSLSKISTVRLTVRQGGRTVWTNSATVGAGHPKLLWVTPSRAGSYSISLSATDLAGNFSTAAGTITLRAH